MTTRTFTAAGEAMTPVPTAFLAEHMLSAPSDYVKVYLYGVYLSSNPRLAETVHMESSLHMKASDIDAALRYWERVGLVRLDDKGGVQYLYGQQPARQQPARPQPLRALPDRNTQQQVHAEEMRPWPQLAAAREREDGVEPYPYVAFNLQVADVLGREPTATELSKCYEWLSQYDFPKEVVLALIRHCIDVKGSRVSFSYMDKCAADWATKDIDCIEAAEAFVELYHRRKGGAKQLLTDMGITRRDPDITELDLYSKWTNEWGFSLDGIRWAMKGKEFNFSAPFKYLDQILAGFHERGAHQAQEIEKLGRQAEAERSEAKQILAAVGISEAVSRPQMEMCRKWKREGFSQSVILQACAKVGSRGPKGERLRQVDALLSSWLSKGTVSESQVTTIIAEEAGVDRKVREVFDAASIEPQPLRDSDRRLYTRFTQEKGMDHSVLLYAAELSSIQAEPRRYLGRVLEEWAKAGVKTLDQAARAAQAHEQQMATRSGPGGGAERSYEERPHTVQDDEQREYEAMRDMEARYGQL